MPLKRALFSLCLPPCLVFASTSDLPSLVKDHTQCAFSLYQATNPSQNNFVFSPYSISTCLSLVYLGARGETQAQMEKALCITLDRKQLGVASQSLGESLAPTSSKPQDYKLVSANALWVDQSLFLLTDFRYAVEKQFKASLNKISFSKTEEALATINQWVSNQTQHKIPHILSEGDINPLTRLVLVNSLYFQGSWVHPFETKKTQDWPFHPTAETSLPVPMMQQVATLPYYENDLLQAAAFPFRGSSSSESEISLLILLPKSSENFSLMVSELVPNFNSWVSSLSSTHLDVKIPKWTHNTRLNLNAILKERGMEDAFTAEANFTGIDGMRDLHVDTVVHQAFFSVDERGVIAAAATAASMGLMCCGPQKDFPLPFYADHPFLYFLVDLKSQEILFMGAVTQPGSP